MCHAQNSQKLQNSLLITLIAGNWVLETGFAGLHPPPSSQSKLAVEDLPAERPIFGRFFAIVRAALASLRIRSRLLGRFWGACLRRQKSGFRRRLGELLEN